MRQPKLKQLAVILVLMFLLTACGGEELPITVLVNTGAEDFVAAAAAEFNSQKLETAEGDRVIVLVTSAEAGEATVDLTTGTAVPPDMWIPDDAVWVNIAADQGNSNFQANCSSVASSPLVIGMWREVAELFGWPGRELGWLDVGSIAADQSAWQYYSGGQYGDTLRLGHTHPGLSGSGTSTLLALVQSAENKSTAVTSSDINQPIVQASVSAFEGSVAWFSKGTETLGATMAERGAEFLGAAVMYESTVLAKGRGEIVPIYPFEGTFVATHPACISDSSNASKQMAADTFRTWLQGPEGQALAVTYGMRPLDNSDTSALAAFAGVDLAQPEIVFAAPSVETVYAVQALWQSARKPIHLAMLLDTSGSMRGGKVQGMLEAAEQFVGQMGDNDYLTLIEFYSEADVIVERAKIGDNREELINVIRQMEAGGDTSLYDAIGLGSEVLTDLNSVDTANAMVILTDGQDTSSNTYQFNANLFKGINATNATVFTIAYGRDADDRALEEIADQANGQFFQGDEANIGDIYGEMSAAFGGSVGIGR